MSSAATKPSISLKKKERRQKLKDDQILSTQKKGVCKTPKNTVSLLLSKLEGGWQVSKQH